MHVAMEHMPQMQNVAEDIVLGWPKTTRVLEQVPAKTGTHIPAGETRIAHCLLQRPRRLMHHAPGALAVPNTLIALDARSLLARCM